MSGCSLCPSRPSAPSMFRSDIKSREVGVRLELSSSVDTCCDKRSCNSSHAATCSGVGYRGLTLCRTALTYVSTAGILATLAAPAFLRESLVLRRDTPHERQQGRLSTQRTQLPTPLGAPNFRRHSGDVPVFLDLIKSFALARRTSAENHTRRARTDRVHERDIHHAESTCEVATPLTRQPPPSPSPPLRLLPSLSCRLCTIPWRSGTLGHGAAAS